MVVGVVLCVVVICVLSLFRKVCLLVLIWLFRFSR